MLNIQAGLELNQWFDRIGPDLFIIAILAAVVAWVWADWWS